MVVFVDRTCIDYSESNYFLGEVFSIYTLEPLN